MAPSPTDIVPFLYNQVFTRPSVTEFSPSTSLQGKTIIITGANSGLGFEASGKLLKFEFSRLIIAVRSRAKGDRAREQLLKEAAEHGLAPRIDIWDLDVASYDSIIAFAERCRGLDRIDCFMCNAGILAENFSVINGYEAEVAVNVVGTLLVATLVLPTLRKIAATTGKDVKLFFTGSAVHKFADPSPLVHAATGEMLKNVTEYARKRNSEIYVISKLMMMMAVDELAQRERHTDNSGRVIIYNVHPGWCGTDLFRPDHLDFSQRMGFRLLGWTQEEGSRTLVHAATQAGRESHGKYLSECKIKNESVWLRSKEGRETQRRLYEELMNLFEEVAPGASQR